jgi:D-alanyl-D-alanine carboxypeptidase/D-alanyl-D-alanine-endopeptidase (penicillin-binding protein 4)
MLRLRYLLIALACAAASLTTASAPAAATSRDATPEPSRPAGPGQWVGQIDRLIGRRSFGVAVREGDAYLYRHQDARLRTPASNEKLLLSMAMLATLGPDARLVTQVASPLPVVAGVVPGDLWILGQGDPAVGPRRMEQLANALQAAGILQIDGSVVGSTGFFKRDWRAPGWKSYFPREHIPLPTALTFEGNTSHGTHIRDPEVRAAKELTEQLKARGIRVSGKPEAGKPPAGLLPVAEAASKPIAELLEFTNRYSSNFYAEVLGKRLGVEHAGVPGTISKGAAAIRAWAGARGVRVRPHDSSGLSYANRVSPAGLVSLLGAAELELWGEAFRETLPRPGQGTLKGRMKHLEVRAKTGTLTDISSLSGWVFLRRERVWAEFSILSRGVPQDQAKGIEDAIVRTLARSATLSG